MTTATKALDAAASDEALWAELKAEATEAMMPVFRALLEAGAESVIGEPVGEKQLEVDTETLRALLAEVLPAYTDQWWASIAATTQNNMREIIARNVAAGLPVDNIIKEMEPLFGPVRAHRIAVTETTRLFAKGAVTGYRAAGVERVRWRTARDGWVCGTCADRAGQTWPLGQHEEPPAHVHCRCFIGPVAET